MRSNTNTTCIEDSPIFNMNELSSSQHWFEIPAVNPCCYSSFHFSLFDSFCYFKDCLMLVIIVRWKMWIKRTVSWESNWGALYRRSRPSSLIFCLWRNGWSLHHQRSLDWSYSGNLGLWWRVKSTGGCKWLCCSACVTWSDWQWLVGFIWSSPCSEWLQQQADSETWILPQRTGPARLRPAFHMRSRIWLYI